MSLLLWSISTPVPFFCQLATWSWPLSGLVKLSARPSVSLCCCIWKGKRKTQRGWAFPLNVLRLVKSGLQGSNSKKRSVEACTKRFACLWEWIWWFGVGVMASPQRCLVFARHTSGEVWCVLFPWNSAQQNYGRLISTLLPLVDDRLDNKQFEIFLFCKLVFFQ